MRCALHLCHHGAAVGVAFDGEVLLFDNAVCVLYAERACIYVPDKL